MVEVLCLFCEKEAMHFKKVPNRDVTIGLCNEHYMARTSGEILEFWKKYREADNEENKDNFV